MKNIKRTVRKFGKPLGHRKGIEGSELLNYLDARIHIFLPSYLWVLENKVSSIINRLKKAAETKDFVLLDYTTNCDVLDLNKPLSHAYLIKAYVEGKYPNDIELYKELEIRMSKPEEELIKKKVKNSRSNKTKENRDENQSTLF